MRTALLQLCSSDAPSENLAATAALVEQAAAEGAGFVLTPEVVNCVSTSRRHQHAVLQPEPCDPTLAALRDSAAKRGIWLLIGSLALKTPEAGNRLANRQFLIDPAGEIRARYDKIHMFDVAITPQETYRESASYRPGDRAVVAQTAFAAVGMSICYDLRFAYLYRALAQAGAEVLVVPAAFSPITGAAHWHSLLRARAIETGCFVLAPAQCGQHRAHRGSARKTYGHSLAVSPWGEVLGDGGDAVGITYADIDLAHVQQVRRQVPALSHDRAFAGP